MLTKPTSPSRKSVSVSPKLTRTPRCFNDSPRSIKTKHSNSNVGDNDLFVKRGKKGNKSGIMEKAFTVIKELSNEPTVQMDAYDHFGAYVAARLRNMDAEQWRKVELEIMKILTSIP